MRKIEFRKGEYYHVYNRGVEKREIFSDLVDLNRFFRSMSEFNTVNPIGSIYEESFRKKELGNPVTKRLVNFVCYCLNPNHYHFILTPLNEYGIEKFMQKIGTGYTRYFNERNKRSGVLFQGPFKAIHINSNEYLLHLSAYVNLNNRVHQLGNGVTKSSWKEYFNTRRERAGFCEKEVVLGQFRNADDYKEFAENALKGIRERKDLQKMLIE